jgi:hypothetical protein
MQLQKVQRQKQKSYLKQYPTIKVLPFVIPNFKINIFYNLETFCYFILLTFIVFKYKDLKVNYTK